MAMRLSRFRSNKNNHGVALSTLLLSYKNVALAVKVQKAEWMCLLCVTAERNLTFDTDWEIKECRECGDLTQD